MILLDASFVIAFLDGADVHHAAAEKLLVRAIDDDLAASSHTMAEVFVVPVRDGQLESVQVALRHLEVAELPFPANAAVRLAQLRAVTHLLMPDCCVLLAAEDAGAVVASFDDRLAQAAEDLGLVVLRR